MRDGVRRDTRRNSRRLIAAVGEIAKERPASLSMAAVAERADVAPATAYRHFASVEQLLEAFRVGIVAELAAFTEASTESGAELYTAVLTRWYELVLEHGPALVQLRSREGFLARLLDGGEYSEVTRRAWERPIQELCAADGLEDPGDMGLFLCNIVNDPRELLDLTAHGGAPPAAIIAGLQRTALGAIGGWSGGEGRPGG